MGKQPELPARPSPRASHKLLPLLVLTAVAVSLSTFPSFPPLSWPFSGSSTAAVKDTEKWQDNVWPILQPTAWDISADFPYARSYKYTVQEGTWLRLDIHPKTGDIVFDMLGDLYCLPRTSYTTQGRKGRTTAIPVLTGIPYDSDPHFSPDGTRLVFRSDAELGVENIWTMEWKGCTERERRVAAQLEQDEERDWDVTETAEMKQKRLMREGRSSAIRVTNETYRWISDARFHPSGETVIATKWYTSSRSLGAGEAWEYDVPSSPTKIGVGSGRQVLGRTLPLGWTEEQYGDQQIGPEQIIWSGKDSIIFSKNVADASAFDYSKDVHSGIYAIFSRNLTTGVTETLVSAFPGGASRPEISHDKRSLAFVRRVRDKEALVVKDLQTGTIHHIWYGLTYDLTSISAPMGTYPSFSFTPDDGAIIIWAAGQIWHVPVEFNDCGERAKHRSESPQPIPFEATIQKQLADTRSEDFDLTAVETADTQRTYAFKGLSADHEGHRVVFQAAGKTYQQLVGDDSGPHPVPVSNPSASYYSPSWVSGTTPVVIQARWEDDSFSGIEIADIRAKVAYELRGLPLGRYYSPILCSCKGRSRTLAFIKLGGDLLTGDIVATSSPGLYLAELEIPEIPVPQTISVKNLRFVPSEINVDDYLRLRFEKGNSRLAVQQSHRSFVIDLSASPNEKGQYPHTTIASGRMSTESALAPGGDTFAMVEFMNVYLVSTRHLSAEEAVWSKPGNSTSGLARTSLHGGHDITFSGDGKTLFWFLGPYLHSLEVAKLSKCSHEIKADHTTLGIACVKNLLHYQELEIHHSTDIARLRREASIRRSDTLIVHNVTVLHMDPSSEREPSLGILTIRDGLIKSVFSQKEMGAQAYEDLLEESAASGLKLIDGFGGYVVPGFIDVHAHWSGFSNRVPAKSWELQTFLAYGVTTLHNPSADNVDAFVERSRVESGQMIGPRIFSVGSVVYGAAEESLHQPIVDMDTAYAALIRIKAEGGPGAISYKNYNQPSRAYRQRLLLAARNLSMLCVPEGGMNLDWDITYILDGMTTVEHALPVPVLYDDIKKLFVHSGTGSTPTHVVNYGGTFGEQYVWATEDIPNDSKLRQFTRHDTLEGLTESTARPWHSYALFNTSASTADMVHSGLKAHIGAHGEPPLGLNYHAEMFFTKQGGLSNYEVLRAATYDAAVTLGLDSSIGSLTKGKLADFLIYHPHVDLLNDDISATREIKYVVRGGRMWEAETMEEVWPVKGRRQVMPPINAD